MSATVYDKNNIFARILRGEIPCSKVFENDDVLAFHDIHPQAPVHVLVIPKGEYVTFGDFVAAAPATTVAAFFQAVGTLASTLGVIDSGYRIVSNNGTGGGQEVPHFHVHLKGGKGAVA
jgi:diadenosine tetraphosphate (Ap4A) HIT family hydrolase